MNHDGSPSPMYWVFWTIFQNSQTFPDFPGIPGVPTLLQVVLEGSERIQTALDSFWVVWTYLGTAGCNWRSLDIWWACLDSSRTFGLRHMLAGQSCRCQVGIAHGGSRIEVVGVREQLDGQGDSALRYVSFMGWVLPFRIPLMRGMARIHG